MAEYYVHPRYLKKPESIETPVSPTVAPPVTSDHKPTKPVRNLPCINLAGRVDKSCTTCWKGQWHNCTKLGIKCRPGFECQTCTSYEPDQ